MAAENCLWGAPRIHGELLKLGIAISERTVTRYLRGRPPRRSQTWRTFFANHLGDPTPTSPETFADARGDDIVVDVCDLSFLSTQLLINGNRAVNVVGGELFVRPATYLYFCTSFARRSEYWRSTGFIGPIVGS
jgi:hypothetical protein